MPSNTEGGDHISAKLWTGHCGSVLSLAYSADGSSLATSSSDGRIIVWACSDDENQPYTQRALCCCAASVSAVSWLDNCTLFCNAEVATKTGAGAGRGAELWRVEAASTFAIGHTPSRQGTSVPTSVAAWSPAALADTRAGERKCPLLGMLATAVEDTSSGDSTTACACEIEIWRAGNTSNHGSSAAPLRLTALHGHSAKVTALEFSDDGAFLASGSADQSVLVWDVSTLRTAHPMQRHAAWCCRRLSHHTSMVTALSWGTTTSSTVEVVVWLLGQGADPNLQDNTNKWTALHWAAYRGHATVVVELVRHGADASLISKNGYTAQQVAEQQGHGSAIAVALAEGVAAAKVRFPSVYV